MPTALDVCRVASIKPPATDLLASATDARNFVDLLMAQNFWMEAVAYLSHAITARESIWWAWFCARKAAQGKEDPGATNALAIAEAWIAQPTEENRIKARKTAEREPNGHRLALSSKQSTPQENSPMKPMVRGFPPFLFFRASSSRLRFSHRSISLIRRCHSGPLRTSSNRVSKSPTGFSSGLDTAN